MQEGNAGRKCRRMKLIIKNCDHPYNDPSGVEARKVWISPDEHYVVAEVFTAEYFAAGEIIERDASSDTMTIVCRDCVSADTDEVDYHSYRVEWDCMCYGFCKIISRSLESNHRRAFRIYFDPALYRQTYGERNGAPYDGRKTFSHTQKRI